MNRAEKVKALQQAFSTGNLQHLTATNEKMVIHAVVVECGGWLQIVPIEPTFQLPQKELMTLKEYQDFISCIPLFPDLHDDIKK